MDQRHPLYVLAAAIDWKFFEREFGSLYVEQKGRPGLPMRLLVRLHYLKHLYSVSDERVAETNWARRGGATAGGNDRAVQRQQALKPSELRRVSVDTTVQEKAIAFPTDARLYHKARCVLVREAKRVGLELRQSYRRVGKRALQKQGRYAHAPQLKRARRETRKLRITWAG